MMSKRAIILATIATMISIFFSAIFAFVQAFNCFVQNSFSVSFAAAGDSRFVTTGESRAAMEPSLANLPLPNNEIKFAIFIVGV